MSTQESGDLQDTLVQDDGATQPRSTPLKTLAWPQGVLLTAGGSGALWPEMRRSSMQPERGRQLSQRYFPGHLHSDNLSSAHSKDFVQEEVPPSK